MDTEHKIRTEFFFPLLALSLKPAQIRVSQTEIMTETSSYNMTDELRIIQFAIKKEKKKLRCGVFWTCKGTAFGERGHGTGETKHEHQRKKGVNKTNPTKTLPIE